MSGKMTLNESLDQSYDRMGIRDTILLETLHTLEKDIMRGKLNGV